MITVRNEFETIQAYEVFASGETAREVAIELLDILNMVSQDDGRYWWQQLARAFDDDTNEIEDIQREVADLIQSMAPLPASCTVSLRNGEWLVLPFIDECYPRLEECPDEFTGDDIVYVVNDHGNVTCYEWQHTGEPGISDCVYTEIWSMV